MLCFLVFWSLLLLVVTTAAITIATALPIAPVVAVVHIGMCV